MQKNSHSMKAAAFVIRAILDFYINFHLGSSSIDCISLGEFFFAGLNQ